MFWYYFERGGPIMYPLLAFSIFAIALILERSYFYLRIKLNVHDWFENFLREKGVTVQSVPDRLNTLKRHPMRKIFSALWYDRNMDRKDLEALAQEECEEQLLGLERNLKPLMVIAILSPLVGLLGTVLGIMNAFERVKATGMMNHIQLADGIWQALITTFTGLSIAVPVWLAYYFFSSRVDRQVFTMEFFSSRFVRWMHQKGFTSS